MSEENTTENDYLELAEHARQKYVEMENRIEALRQSNKELVKEILTVYGIVRVVDNQLEEDDLTGHPAKLMIEMVRTHLSKWFDDYTEPTIIISIP